MAEDYAVLGRTGARVSRLCLGTMQFGWTVDRPGAYAVLDAYREAGGNFLDTADIYSTWADGNPGGVAESIVGAWLADRGCRREMVLATKVRGRMWDGPNGEGLSRLHIVAAVEGSLERLGVEAIDLYLTHWPDDVTPIDETLRAMDDLVHAGKVRHVGASNIPAWRLALSLCASQRQGCVRYDVLQPHYNLAHRPEFERELLPLCADEGIAVTPYSPLAGGFLTGKYRLGSPAPDSARARTIERRYMTEDKMALLDAVEAVAGQRGATTAQVALAWLLAQPTVTSLIVGANTPAQLAELLPAAALQLDEGELSRLDSASSVAGRD